jgi:hypothetical protein
MSIFLKTELKNIMDTNSDTNLSLPKWINIVDISEKNKKVNNAENFVVKKKLNGSFNNSELSATSSVIPNMLSGGGDLSATSSAMPNMLSGGGDLSATSSAMPNMLSYSKSLKRKKEDLSNSSLFIQNNLKGGSSKEQNNENTDINKLISMLTSSESHMSNTNTELLELNIKKSLNGGSITNNVNVGDIKNFFLDLKQKGVNVNIQLDNQSMSDFFSNETTTHISDMFLNKQDGGKGPNAGFKAFLELKKYVATKLNISNGPNAGSIAGVIQKEMKEKHKDMDSVNISNEGKKHLDKNIEKYKAMVKK